MERSNDFLTNEDFLGSLANNLEIKIDSKYYTQIEEGLEEIFAEVIGKKLKSSVYVSRVENDDSKIDSVGLVVGESLKISRLLNLGYSRVERVWEEGEFSVLGDVLMVWPFGMKHLLRVSFMVDEIESIEIVESGNRRKIKNISAKELFSKNFNTVVGNETFSKSKLLYITDNIEPRDGEYKVGLRRIPGIYNYTDLHTTKRIIKNYKNLGYKVWYLSRNFERFQKSLTGFEEYIDKYFEANSSLEKKLDRGFIYEKSKLLLLTDLEVLGEIDISELKKDSKKIDVGTLEILKKIIPGDYLVHEDHGIGIFKGVVEKKDLRYLDIHYARNDRLLIPFTALEKVTKYIGAGRKKPKLTGLNSGVWSRISSTAKKEADSIARELLQLYALRSTTKTPQIISNDGQREDFWNFVNKFEFQDTEDQLVSTNHILEDFQKDNPMDRLLVGDVGFGKTEIAMRAAFAVVNAGFQVAILAPTTILVRQHLTVFKERFEGYPFTIESLSRFNSKKEREKILSSLENGGIDIIIGTHSLLSKSVKFKDLNLIIVDEEQKFGVKQKEHLKGLRLNSNILSMTATPIPRTLNLSLMGIRDISVLVTPPLGRKEIINEFNKFSWKEVERIVKRELDRGGQVFYLHNRVSTIQSVQARLNRIFPNSVVEILHGQMNPKRIEQTMETFISGEIDILLCTTIIENGLDIPNVNTLIVDDINIFGLSQLYQIRGRIGRGSKQAYACFMFERLKGDSLSRLKAIKEAQNLGSGYILSNRDLEIRGAGDILGRNQSGTINSIGYGLYTRLLTEAVARLKAL